MAEQGAQAEASQTALHREQGRGANAHRDDDPGMNGASHGPPDQGILSPWQRASVLPSCGLSKAGGTPLRSEGRPGSPLRRGRAAEGSQAGSYSRGLLSVPPWIRRHSGPPEAISVRECTRAEIYKGTGTQAGWWNLADVDKQLLFETLLAQARNRGTHGHWRRQKVVISQLERSRVNRKVPAGKVQSI